MSSGGGTVGGVHVVIYADAVILCIPLYDLFLRPIAAL